MSDDRPEGGEVRPPRDRAQGQEGPRGKPYGKPGGQPYGKPGGKPHGGKPYGKPGGKPYGGKPYGKPVGRPYGERVEGDRRVEQQRRPRPPGPRGQRPPWERERERQRGPGRPRRPWDRDAVPARTWRGPPPAELLGEDEEIVAGRRPVEEAFAARREARRLLVVPDRRAALDQLVLHATTLRIPVVEVEGGSLTAVSGFDGHQGVALVVAPRRWATLDDVLALARSRGEPPFLLALDHLEDPQNVGTLLRSAEACGVHGVIFPTRGAAPISPAAIKTSAGAIEHLLLVPLPDLAGGLAELHARGLRVVGADGDARLTVREVDLRGPVVIVTGSEGRGLHATVRRRVDVSARIPMRGKVASLNASVAGSIFLFEAAAQRFRPRTGEASEPGAPPAAEAPPEAKAPTEPGAPPEAEAPRAPVETDGPEPTPDEDELLPESPPPPPAARPGSRRHPPRTE